jgi:tripartite-type tricarboxylate transporter receptor subunit TctC
MILPLLKANPNKVSAGITTVGYRFLMAVFQKETGTQFTLVPYRGAASEMQDLVAGQIDLLFDSLVQLALVRAGMTRAYGVTSDARMALAPNIPTFAEMGLSALSHTAWLGLFAPRGTPAGIIYEAARREMSTCRFRRRANRRLWQPQIAKVRAEDLKQKAAPKAAELGTQLDTAKAKDAAKAAETKKAARRSFPRP